MSSIAASGFVWTAAARRSVNVLVAMQAMHMCATQVVMLASDDLLVGVLRRGRTRALIMPQELHAVLSGNPYGYQSWTSVSRNDPRCPSV
jgi:hypothetical protein